MWRFLWMNPLRTQAVIRPEDDNQLKKAVEVLNNGQ